MGGKAAMLNSGVWDTKKFDQSDLAGSIYYWWGPTFSDGIGNQNVSMKAPAHPYCVSAKVQKEDPDLLALMEEQGLLSEELTAFATPYAAERGAAEVGSFLMDYRRRHSGRRKKTFEL